jgi:peroxiredoxin
MKIQVGQKAPDFTLYNTENQKVSLTDFYGKQHVLVLFFPKAFTEVCTKEFCTIQDDIGRYNHANAAVLGISVDAVTILEKYKEELQLNFQLLSDSHKVTSEAYESIYPSLTDVNEKGVSKRSAFVIDKQGVIQYMEILENAGELPDFNAINEAIDRLDK